MRETLLQIVRLLDSASSRNFKAGQKKLKAIEKNPALLLNCLSLLSEQLDESIHFQCVQVLDKRFKALYPKLSPAEQLSIRNQLLGFMVTAEHPAIGEMLGRCIGYCAQHLKKAGTNWPEVVQTIQQIGANGSTNSMLKACSLIAEISHRLEEAVAPHTALFVQMLSHFYGSITVEVMAVFFMRACLMLAENLVNCEEMLLLQPLIVPMGEIMARFALMGMFDEATTAMKFFSIPTASETAFLENNVENIVRLLMSILSNYEIEVEICEEAMAVITEIVEKRPLLFCRNNQILPNFLISLKNLVTGEEPWLGQRLAFGLSGDSLEEDLGIALPNRRITLGWILLDCAALNIPSKHFIPCAKQLWTELLSSPTDTDRWAGCLIVATIAEGCRVPVRAMLDELMPKIIELAADPVPVVREASMFTIHQFSDHCWPDILYYSDSVLSAFCKVLEDPALLVQAEACSALEKFGEYLSRDKLRPYLQQLLLLLGNILTCSSVTVVSLSLTAIGTVAVSVEDDFIPFAEAMLNFLNPLLFDTNPAHVAVRLQASVVLGHIAVAIGKERFLPYFVAGLQSNFDAFVESQPKLLEGRYIYLMNTAALLQESMGTYFPQILPDLVERISSTLVPQYSAMNTADSDDDSDDEDMSQDNGSQEGEEGVNDANEEDNEQAGNDDEEDDDQDSGNVVQVEGSELNYTFVHQKVAISAASLIAKNAPIAFQSEIERFTEILQSNGYFDHVDPDVASAAVRALGRFGSSVASANNVVNSPDAGVLITLEAPIVEKVSKYLTICLDIISVNPRKEVVEAAFNSINDIVDKLGYSVLRLVLPNAGFFGEQLMRAILGTLQFKLVCQSEDVAKYDVDENEAGEKEENDDNVMIAAVELINTVAKRVGADFTFHFEILLPNLLKFVQPTHSYADRAMAIGCICDCLECIGMQVMKYIPTLLPVFRQGLEDEAHSVRRNSAYSINVIVKATGTALADHFSAFLSWLLPLCARDGDQSGSSGGGDIDNAISAVCTIIITDASKVQLEVALPAILNGLPFQEDFDESMNVFKCFAGLLQAANPTAIRLLGPILQMFGQELISTAATSTTAKKEFIADSIRLLVKVETMKSLLLPALQTIGDRKIQDAIAGLIMS